uniref:Uncharacterized protein n=1 Tax=Romanomermis culicivorax TaxID=13658 RepID=A0A915HNQ7_ROMCU
MHKASLADFSEYLNSKAASHLDTSKAQDNAQSPTKFDLQKRPPGSKRNAPGRNGGTKGVGRKKNPKSGTNDGSGKLNRQTRYAAVDPHAGRMRQVNRNKKPTSKLTRSKTPQFKQGSNKTPQRNQVRPPNDMMPADAPYLEQKAAPSATRVQTFRYRLRKNRKGKEICVNTETKKVVKMRICEMLFGKSATAKDNTKGFVKYLFRNDSCDGLMKECSKGRNMLVCYCNEKISCPCGKQNKKLLTWIEMCQMSVQFYFN